MKTIKTITVLVILFIIGTSCERVAPNYVGVLMENYGKSGKSDYSIQSGRVSTLSPGTELFQVPLWEQRGSFENSTDSGNVERILHLKAADNTEFTVRPVYSYTVIKERAIDLVFQNSRLGSGEEFMKKLEDNVLEPHIYDLIKEESRKYTTDTLMANGGSLKFEQRLQEIINKSFEDKGLKLITLSCQVDFSDEVKGRINARNEVSTNVSVLDQQIIEQRKRNELALLKAQENINLSKGLTKEVLIQQFISKWDGKAPIYGSTPISVMLNSK